MAQSRVVLVYPPVAEQQAERPAERQPAWPQLDSTDTPPTLDEGPFDAAVEFLGYPLGWEEDDSIHGYLFVMLYASPAPREVAEAFFGDDEDCSVASQYPPLAEQGPDHVLVNVGAEVIAVPQDTTGRASYMLDLPGRLPSGTTFGLSGTQTLALLGPPDLDSDTINAIDSWDGGNPIDIAWTPGSEETFMVDRADETGTWDATCRVVNDGLWTLPAVDQSAWFWSVWIGRGRAVAVDSPELGHVLLYTWSAGGFDYVEYPDYDDM